MLDYSNTPLIVQESNKLNFRDKLKNKLTNKCR